MTVPDMYVKRLSRTEVPTICAANAPRYPYMGFVNFSTARYTSATRALINELTIQGV
jgi:hypothetical protein